jgi:hypothetical protein
MKRLSLVLASIAALGLAFEAAPAVAADPPSGTIDPKNKIVEWAGPMTVVAANVAGQAGPEQAQTICALPLPGWCDVFELTVNIPETGYSASGGVKIDITFSNANSDWDVYVYDEGGSLVGSSTGGAGAQESVILPRATGTYTVQTNGFTVVNDQYMGVAEAFGLAKPKPKPKPKKKKK